MYRLLFELAGFALTGWLLLIFLPRWRVTRKIAETAIFPIYLSVLYLVGIGAVIAGSGVGFMADFGSASGVVSLLATEPVALIAWIHILAFDQVVGLLIYRDNMKNGYVPAVVQSVLLVATLMLGPVGFLSYMAIRLARGGRGFSAWDTAESSAPIRGAAAPAAPQPAAVAIPRFHSVVPDTSVVQAVLVLLRSSHVLVWLAALGFALAVATAGIALFNGGWLLAPEGRLLEAAKFNVAIGIYLLTLALILPFAPFTERGRRRWLLWSVGVSVFAYGMETIQSWRGLDPRFSAVAGPIDQALGGVFLLAALTILVLFVILMSRFRSPQALPDHPNLRLAFLYGSAASMLAFGVGVVMSFTGGRALAAAGDLMPIHAAGFHGLQAVPVVALLLGAAAGASAASRLTVHLAGAGWLVLCAGLVLQAFTGNPPLAVTPAMWISVAGGTAWLAALLTGLRTRYMPAAIAAPG